jgi:hypothetical protein
MASVLVVLFRPPDFTTDARHHKCFIFSKCSVSPTDFAEEAKIYADKADLTAEKVFARDKRTLGNLVKDLKLKALVSEDIEALLQKVLDDRNMFAHNLRHQEWFDLSTHAGRERALDFLMPFTQNLNLAIQFFIALHVKHGDEIGFDSPDMIKIKGDELWRVKEFYPYADKIQKKG